MKGRGGGVVKKIFKKKVVYLKNNLYIKVMKIKVIKLEDLKEGMELVGVKNVYYVDRDSMEGGLMLEEELKEELSLIIGVGRKYKVSIEDGEVFLIDENGEYNEGWYNVENMLKKRVFEII